VEERLGTGGRRALALMSSGKFSLEARRTVGARSDRDRAFALCGILPPSLLGVLERGDLRAQCQAVRLAMSRGKFFAAAWSSVSLTDLRRRDLR